MLTPREWLQDQLQVIYRESNLMLLNGGEESAVNDARAAAVSAAKRRAYELCLRNGVDPSTIENVEAKT